MQLYHMSLITEEAPSHVSACVHAALDRGHVYVVEPSCSGCHVCVNDNIWKEKAMRRHASIFISSSDLAL